MSTLVIDPGHGKGKDGKWRRPLMTLHKGKVKQVSGTEFENDWGFYREDMGVLDIAFAVEKGLIALGHEVYLTRRDERNSALYLAEGTESDYKVTQSMINNWGTWRWSKMLSDHVKADAFVSLHTNASGGSGIVGFYASPKAIDLIENISLSIKEEFNELKYRGAKKHKYLVLRDHAKGNTCLMECMFHDHPVDLGILIHKECRDLIGLAVARGINKFLEKG